MNKPLLLCLAFLSLAAPRIHAQAPVSFDFFYSSLDPYGQWVQVGDYGYCWHPNNVGADWRPYADGYWAYTDDGWTWVSYEEFGSITYHYGRWLRVDNYGWCWTPDYQWAPAWVSWRCGGDYVGWAPLPPEARFQVDVGFNAACDTQYDIGPTCYNFCEAGSFGSPALLSVLIVPGRNVVIINETVNVTNVVYSNNAIINGGPDFRAMSARSRNPIPAMQLVRRTDPAGGAFARRVGNQLIVAAPNVAPPSPGSRPARVAQVLPRERVDRGWNGVSDPAVKAGLREKFAQERGAQSPANIPIRPVGPAPNQNVQNVGRTELHPFLSPAARGTAVGERTVQAGPKPENVKENNQAAREQEFREESRPAARTVQPNVEEKNSDSRGRGEVEPGRDPAPRQ